MKILLPVYLSIPWSPEILEAYLLVQQGCSESLVLLELWPSIQLILSLILFQNILIAESGIHSPIPEGEN